MNLEKLNNLNALSRKIIDIQSSEKDIVNLLKEIELKSYYSDFSVVRIDHNDVKIEKNRMIKFLRSELEITQKELKALKEKFEKE